MSYPPQQPAAYPAYPPSAPTYPQASPSYPPVDASTNKAAYGSAPYFPPNYDAHNTVAPLSPDNRYQPPTGPQDVWAAILFALQLFALFALSGLTIPKLFSPSSSSNDSSSSFSDQSSVTARTTTSYPFRLNSNTIIAVVGSSVFALLLAVGYLFAMRKWPKQLIKYTFWISIAMSFIMGIVAVMKGSIFAGVALIITGVLYIVFYRAYKSRMPFASLILETVSDVTIKYPGTVSAGIIGLIIQLAFVALWALTLISSSLVFGQADTRNVRGPMDSKMSSTTYVLILYLMFSFYWTVQVIKNVVHVTVSGVFASFYFLAGSPQGMSASPTAGAFKRAVSTSFGSIAYGSLLIALIQTVRSIVRSLGQESNSLAGAILACCIDCLLSWIESLAEIFNKYAFTQVAIYGKDFCRAAKDTWTLIKDRGIEALINDDLIDNVIRFGSLLVAFISAFVGWAIYSIGTATSGNPTSEFDVSLIIVLVVAFMAGWVMFSMIAGVISSGVATTFVCLAEDPAALRATKPELYQRVVQTYPEAQISMYS